MEAGRRGSVRLPTADPKLARKQARTHAHTHARARRTSCSSSAPLQSASDFAPPALELPAGQALHDGGFGAVELPPPDHVPCGTAVSRGIVSALEPSYCALGGGGVCP